MLQNWHRDTRYLRRCGKVNPLRSKSKLRRMTCHSISRNISNGAQSKISCKVINKISQDLFIAHYFCCCLSYTFHSSKNYTFIYIYTLSILSFYFFIWIHFYIRKFFKKDSSKSVLSFFKLTLISNFTNSRNINEDYNKFFRRTT